MIDRADRAPSPRLQRTSIVIAGFGQNMVLTFVSTFLLLYLTEYAKISNAGLAVVSVILAAAKVFDAVNDPVMGVFVDKTRSRWGKLRPYILFSALPVAFFSAILFCLPNSGETFKLVFFAVCLLFWDAAYTACDVPFWGLIGAAFESEERTRVISYVRAFGAIALGLATLGGPWLAKLLSFSADTTAAGWSRAAIVICIVGMSMFLLAFFNTRERHLPPEEGVSLKTLFATFFKNKPLYLVLLGSILGFGRDIVQAGGAVFALIAYHDEGYFTLIGASIILGMVAASFLSPLLLRRMPARTLMIASTLFASAVYAAMYFVGFANLYAMMGMIFLTGVTLGVFSVVQTTMIADAVDSVERETGVRNDGLSFSSLTFVSKLMGSLAVLVFGMMLSFTGYESGIVVTPQMQNTVFLSITIIPALSCLVSIVPFLLYKLPQEDRLRQ
ncbi:MAG: MFS transporter [Clostridiales bacterium]|nr:MFS transporter [Clostridiales bacterium]